MCYVLSIKELISVKNIRDTFGYFVDAATLRNKPVVNHCDFINSLHGFCKSKCGK
jgi:hypothetical protein